MEFSGFPGTRREFDRATLMAEEVAAGKPLSDFA